MPIEIEGKQVRPWLEAGFEKPKGKVSYFKAISTTPPRRRTEEGFITVPAPPVIFETFYTRTTLSGDTETVRYFKNKTKRQEGNVMVDVFNPGFLEINGGVMQVAFATDPDLYWFLVNHPRCRTNPVYDEIKNPTSHNLFKERMANNFLFEEKLSEKSSAQKLEMEVRISEAIGIIKAYTKTETDRMYRAFSLSGADDLVAIEDYDTMRMGIIDAMKHNYKKWLKLSEDTGISVRAIITDAQSLSVIKFTDSEWVWNLTSEVQKKPTILRVSVPAQAEEEFYDFLRTQKRGQLTLQTLEKEVGFAKANPDARREHNYHKKTE